MKSHLLLLITCLLASNTALACGWEMIVTNRTTREIRYFKPTASEPARFEVRDEKSGTDAECSGTIVLDSDRNASEKVDKLRTNCAYKNSNNFGTTATATDSGRKSEVKDSVLFLFGTDPKAPTFEVRATCQ